MTTVFYYNQFGFLFSEEEESKKVESLIILKGGLVSSAQLVQISIKSLISKTLNFTFNEKRVNFTNLMSDEITLLSMVFAHFPTQLIVEIKETKISNN